MEIVEDEVEKSKVYITLWRSRRSWKWSCRREWTAHKNSYSPSSAGDAAVVLFAGHEKESSVHSRSPPLCWLHGGISFTSERKKTLSLLDIVYTSSIKFCFFLLTFRECTHRHLLFQWQVMFSSIFLASEIL